MSFRSRNAYYLRIAKNSVLPLYLYLDERHIDWMSDRTLQHVLADLKSLIPPKLASEGDALEATSGAANSKKGTVDVHRGDSYQFAYFLRKVEPHAFVIKSRNFVLAPKEQKRELVPQTRSPVAQRGRGKKRAGARKRKNASPVKPLRRKASKKFNNRVVDVDSDEDGDTIFTDIESDEDSERGAPSVHPPRRSARNRKPVTPAFSENDSPTDSDDEVEIVEGSALPSAGAVDPTSSIHSSTDASSGNTVKQEDDADQAPLIDDPASRTELDASLDVEEEEEKPKPLLRLQYQGFDISGRCLCVVVEPWPPIRSASRAPSLAPEGASRAFSIAPPDFESSDRVAARARTPLFLPEDGYERSRSMTPSTAPLILGGRVLPPVPAFNDVAQGEDEDEDEDNGGLMAFTQSLTFTGDSRIGDAAEDDDFDGSVMFQDADERKEL